MFNVDILGNSHAADTLQQLQSLIDKVCIADHPNTLFCGFSIIINTRKKENFIELERRILRLLLVATID